MYRIDKDTSRRYNVINRCEYCPLRDREIFFYPSSSSPQVYFLSLQSSLELERAEVKESSHE